MEIFSWSLTAVLMLAGLVGVIVPMMPGTTLIFAAAIIHKWLLPASLSWTPVVVIGGIWLVSVIADFLGVVVGARLFGGSKWGMAGAGGGAFVGMFFSLPGLLIGTILGAAAAEKLLAKKNSGASLKAGMGAATGFLISLIARAVCAVAMVAVFCFSVATRA